MNIKYVLLFMGLFFSSVMFASESVKIFSSNNTDIITAQNAYDRLISDIQDNLKNDIIDVIQKYHLEQNKCEDVLGMYQNSQDQKITADNTKVFTTSPYQNLSESKIFEISRQLANQLQQESVAIFIPSKEGSIGDTIVDLGSYPLSISNAINLIDTKLPPTYKQAFTLHLNQKKAGYENARVTSIEWLGSQTKLEEIKKVFPREHISINYGKAFLIYKNGQKQEL